MSDLLSTVAAPEYWNTFVLLKGRLGGLAMTGPLWSMGMVPTRVRAAIVVVLAAVLLPSAPKVAIPDQVLMMPLPLALEFVLGIGIGLTAAAITHGVRLAGEVVSLQMGLSLGAALSPSPELATPGVAQLKLFTALLIYIMMGGHLTLLNGLAESMSVVPPGFVAAGTGGLTNVNHFNTMFQTAARAAAPAMIALLLTNLALAILSRAVPQLNAMMVAFPITIGVGLLLIGAALPTMSSVIARSVSGLPDAVDEVVTGFAPTPAPVP